MVLEGRFLNVVAQAEQVQEGDDNVNWATDDADDLVTVEHGRERHDPRRVCFHDPDSIVDDIFSFEAL